MTWVFIWWLSWGIFFLYIFKKVDYIKNFLFTSAYFLATALITISVFAGHIGRAIEGFVWPPIIALVVFLGVQICVFYFVPKYVREPRGYLENHPTRQFLHPNFRRLFSKSFDILAQQVFVLLLVMFLQDASLALGQIILFFAIIFGAVHVPLIMIDRGAWQSWFFSIFSVISAFVFPVLIAKIHYGFVYSYIVHWSFYLITTTVFLVWQERQSVKIIKANI